MTQTECVVRNNADEGLSYLHSRFTPPTVLSVSPSDNNFIRLVLMHFLITFLATYVLFCVLPSEFSGNLPHNNLQVYNILDEFILSGEVEESSKREILERIRELEKLD